MLSRHKVDDNAKSQLWPDKFCDAVAGKKNKLLRKIWARDEFASKAHSNGFVLDTVEFVKSKF